MIYNIQDISLRTGSSQLLPEKHKAGIGRVPSGLLSAFLVFLAGVMIASAVGDKGLAQEASAPSCSGQTEPRLREEALKATDLQAPERYLRCFPYGDGAISVRERQRQLSEEAECRVASASGNIEEMRSFLMKHSGSACASLVAARIRQVQEANRFVTYANSVLSGTALAPRARSESALACSSACQSRGDQCGGYTFENDYNACTLWSTVQGRLPRGNAQSGTRQAVGIAMPPPPTTPAPAPPSGTPMLYYTDTDFPGGDYLSYNGVALERCNAICLADGQCQAFTYNSNASACFLKTGVNNSVPFRGAISGVRTSALSRPVQSGQIRRLLPGIDLDNSSPALDYSILSQIGLPDCQNICNQDRKCAAFTYNHQVSACILKLGFERRTAFPGATSGIKE